MKIKLMLIAVLLAAPACAALSGNHAAMPDEKLNAENRLMKNNLNLAMRENKVLEEENLQYKAETTRLKTEIRSLHNEIDSLNRKYDTDMAGMTEQYNNVSNQYTFLEESTGKKILELTDLNRKLDKQMKGEISRLNAEMADQKAAFEKLRLALEADFAAQLFSKEALLTEKEATIASMKTMHDDALLQIENLRKEIDRCKTIVSDIDKKNKSLAGPNQALPKTAKEKPQTLDGTGIENRSLMEPDTAKVPAAKETAPPGSVREGRPTKPID